MTVLAERSYRVELPGGVVLDAVGDVELDATRLPHVSGRLTLPGGAADAVDPRAGARVVVTVDDPDAGPRTFDLGVRRRVDALLEGTTELELASDEAILEDYAPTRDDAYALGLFERTYMVEVGELVDMVLATCGMASLQPFDVPFRTVTPFWALENMLSNPRARVDVSGWTGLTSAGSNTITRAAGVTVLPLGVGTMLVHSIGAAASSWSDIRHAAQPSVVAGRKYTLSAYVRIDLGGSVTGSREAAAFLAWRGHNGAPLGDSLGERLTFTDAGSGATGWQRVHVTAEAPVGAVSVLPIVRVFGAMPVGAQMNASMLMLTEGDMLVQWFDGAMPDTHAYRHVWTGAENVSPSRRIPLQDGPEPEALVWRAGTSAMAFLHPLLRAAGLRLVCDEQRRWTLRDETYVADGGVVQLRQGVHLIDASDVTDRDDWCDGRVTRYRWTDRNDMARERIDVFTLPGASRVTEVVVDAAYPGPGRSRQAVLAAIGRGRTVTVTAPAVWTLRAEQRVAIHLDGKQPLVGTVSRVTFDLERDEMTVTAAVRDTAPGAIDLLPGTINALPGTINGL